MLIDDGSSDGSETKCDEYAKKDKRIRLISITELGRETLQKNKERIACMYDRLREYYGEEDFNTLCSLLEKSEAILTTIKEEEQNA